MQKRFFGHFLKGEDNGWDEEPQIVMQVRHPEKPFHQMSAPSWPLPETKWQKLYLEPANHMLTRVPSEEKATIRFNATSDGVTFITSPLDKEVKVVGPSALKLCVSSDTDDADLFAVLHSSHRTASSRASTA